MQNRQWEITLAKRDIASIIQRVLCIPEGGVRANLALQSLRAAGVWIEALESEDGVEAGVLGSIQNGELVLHDFGNDEDIGPKGNVDKTAEGVAPMFVLRGGDTKERVAPTDPVPA